MKPWPIIIGLLFIGVLLETPRLAQAQDACAFGEFSCKGVAAVSVAGGVGSDTHFALSTNLDAAVQHAGADQAIWECNPGDELTFQFEFESHGALPPAAPSDVVIQIRASDDATVIRTFIDINEPVPANGQDFPFRCTSNGLITGTDRSGTFRLYLRVIKDDSPGGIGNYDESSDEASAGNTRGVMRSTLEVDTLTSNAPGTTHAYGPAADNNVRLFANATERFSDDNDETVRLSVIRTAGLAVIQTGATEEIGANGDTTEDFVIDTTFDSALVWYGARFEIIGLSDLTGAIWTRFADTLTSNITRVSDTEARRIGVFRADPRIIFSSDGTTRDDGVACTPDVLGPSFPRTTYNRGETIACTFRLLNALDVQLTRSMTIELRRAPPNDCTGALIQSQSLSGATYTPTRTIPSTDLAQDGLLTSPATRVIVRATNTDQADCSQQAYIVSSTYVVDQDGIVAPETCGQTEQHQSVQREFGASPYNRGETVRVSFWIFGARCQLITHFVRANVTDRDSTTVENSQPTLTPSANGHYFLNYTTTTAHVAEWTTTGRRKEFLIGESTGNGINRFGNFVNTGTGEDDIPGDIFSSVVVARLSRQYRIDQDGLGSPDNLAVTEHADYNRGELVKLNWWVLGARSQIITANVHANITSSTGSNEENFANLAPSPNGHFFANYTAATGDRAYFAEPGGGDLKNVNVTRFGNLGQGTAHRLSRLLHVDSHPQDTATLTKDSFPTDDSAETSTYIIGSQLFFAWANVTGVRRQIMDTTGDAVTFTLTDPDLMQHLSETRDTGTDGWTTPSVMFTPQAPAGIWTIDANASFNANTGGDPETVNFVSAFTANLVLRLLTNTTLIPNKTYPFYARVEQDDACIEPNNPPVFKISYVDESTIPKTWVNEFSLTSMRNVVDNTTTVNGCLYQAYAKLPNERTYQFWAMANISMVGIRDQHASLQVRLTNSTGGGDTFVETLAFSFPGIQEEPSAALLLFLIIMLWAMRKAFLFVAGAALVGVIGMAISATMTGTGLLSFLGAFLLLIIAFWMQYIVSGWRLSDPPKNESGE